MKSLLSCLKGYVRIRFQCEKPERFLNLCARQQILITGLKKEEEAYCCKLPLCDFKKIKPVCRKTHTRVRITGKYGLPFFFYRNKKRKAFFIGILLSCFLIGFLSTRVWNIHIEGNYSNSTPVILKFLEEKEIRHGIAKKDVNCSQIATWVRKQYPDITWVSAKLTGTRLLITVQENKVTESSSQAEAGTTPCHLVAAKDGRIVKMITRQGVPAVTAGTTVKKGDLLVKGQIEILNDAQEVVRYEYVHADADIFLAYTVHYKEIFPLTYTKRLYTGNTKNRCFLEILNKRIILGIPFSDFENFDSLCRSNRVYLTENFLLPISYGTATDMEYLERKETLTKEAATEKANKKLIQFLQELLEKGVQIYQNNVKIDVTDSMCKSEGNLILIENCKTEQALDDLAQPMERNTTDE